jgi:3-oxoacyl-[acyl-carrier-protein] synthase II
MTRERVAVTGLGVKTPAGCDLDSFWSTIVEGTSCAGRIQAFDVAGFPIDFACEVRDFDATEYMDHKEVRRTDRVVHLGLGAAEDAIADAGALGVDPARCAVVVGTGIGGAASHEAEERTVTERGASRISPFFVPMIMPNAAAAHVSMRHGFTGPSLSISTACAASGHAIGEATRLIRDGTAEVVVAGGSEAVVTRLTMAAFHRMGAFSGRADDPASASRPFDPDRDGFVLGEGAAFLVLERWAHAVERGARIYGEVLGYGRNSDAHHVTAPSQGGVGAAACMRLALEDAALTSSDVVQVNAHGTSTPHGDVAEAQAVVKVFSPHGVPVTSTKGSIGHLIGAAGATEAVACLLSLKAGVIPPTANHDRTDPQMEIDVVAGNPRPFVPGPVVSNSFGFGGHNASLIFGPTDT